MQQSELLKGRIASILQKIAQLIFGIDFWFFYCLVFILSILQNGVWFSPQTERLLIISKDIFKNPFLDQPTNQWLLSSFFGPILGYITSTNKSLFTYSLMHLVIFVIFFTILIAVVKRRYGDFIARSVLIIFYLSPISNVLFTWLGSPDILTILLSMMIVIFWDNLIVLFIGAFLLGINHPEQGLIILLLLTIFSFLTSRKKETIKFALIGLGSLLLGKLLVEWYFYSHNFAVEFSRVDYISNAGLFLYVKATFSNPFALLFSLYNVLAIFITTYIIYYWKKEKISFAFIVYSLLAFIIILITLDQTRVFSILTFPGLLLLVFSPSFRSLESAEKEFFKRVLTISFVAGILIPRFVVWMGNIYYSAYQNLIGLLHDYIVGLLLQ